MAHSPMPASGGTWMGIAGPSSRQPRACVQRALLQAEGECAAPCREEGRKEMLGGSAESRQESAGGHEPFPCCSRRETSVGVRIEKICSNSSSWFLRGKPEESPWSLETACRPGRWGAPGPSWPGIGVTSQSQ